MASRLRAIAAAAFLGNLAITLYLATVLAVQYHLSWSTTLRRLLQWDASNALGGAAYHGGWGSALLGVAMDLVVSAVWAALYLAILTTQRVRLLANPWLGGTLLGVIVMPVMRYLVVPIGRAQRTPDSLGTLVALLIAHTLFFGVPVAATLLALTRTRART